MPTLYGVGLTYLLNRAISGPQNVDKVKSTFFLPLKEGLHDKPKQMSGRKKAQI